MIRKRIYPLLDAPIPIPINDMGRKQAHSYLEWFRQNRDRRIGVLSSFLALESPTTEAEMRSALITACRGLFQVSYLTPLDPEVVRGRRQEVGVRLASTISDDELSPETMAYCYDMAALFGKILEVSIPDADITVQLGGKKNIDYGFIVVVSPNRIPINPFRPCTVMAYRAIRGENVEDQMRELLEYYKPS
jgi:hypothetical protein